MSATRRVVVHGVVVGAAAGLLGAGGILDPAHAALLGCLVFGVLRFRAAAPETMTDLEKNPLGLILTKFNWTQDYARSSN